MLGLTVPFWKCKKGRAWLMLERFLSHFYPRDAGCLLLLCSHMCTHQCNIPVWETSQDIFMLLFKYWVAGSQHLHTRHVSSNELIDRPGDFQASLPYKTPSSAPGIAYLSHQASTPRHHLPAPFHHAYVGFNGFRQITFTNWDTALHYKRRHGPEILQAQSTWYKDLCCTVLWMDLIMAPPAGWSRHLSLWCLLM